MVRKQAKTTIEKARKTDNVEPDIAILKMILI